MRHFIWIFILLPFISHAQTLQECQDAAERNYPLIRQYDLIEKTTELTVANIQKGWLPQISASAQATYQNEVAAWPTGMQNMLGNMGISIKGLRKDQYRIGLDVNQTLYDGGLISSQKEIARQQGLVQSAQNEVTMYQVRQRVNEMYFALLQIDEQIQLNLDLQELLSTNEKKLESMYKKGVAAESDYNLVRAERLNVVQQMTKLQSQRKAVALMLGSFCGLQITHVEKPSPYDIATMSQTSDRRPESRLADMQISLANAQERLVNASLMPRLSVFASGFYGYPGYNMFEDMMRHDWSLNGIVGARLTWNIGALYTHKNDLSKIRLQRELAENSRDVFFYNNNLMRIQQSENIECYRKMMEEDEEIISLRSKVRKAAESKLSHGIIDINDLVKEINNENAAKVQQSMHEIEMLKQMYELKYTTND